MGFVYDLLFIPNELHFPVKCIPDSAIDRGSAGKKSKTKKNDNNERNNTLVDKLVDREHSLTM